jgi:2',3'-cyclic-nucleotide 2'-phosphodiesterase (5'-nucleotidase family)
MRRLPRPFLLAAALLIFARPAPAAPPSEPPDHLTLTILHTNDLHGHILPFAYTETGRSKEEQPSVGGAARRATLVRQLRREIRNPVLLLDAGDTFTRGPFTNAYEGIADVEAMNAVGYELAAIGNNEFKAKDAVEATDAAGAQSALLQVVKRARFPWLCANATDGKGAFLEGVQPYVVREFSGVRVGFLGLTAPRSATYPQTKGWTISDPVAAAKAWIPKARAHCDVLIAVTHIGVDMDKELVAQTSGLDAIVGGDSHTYLYKAVEVANTDGRSIPIVQDGEFGADLGRFDLDFTRSLDGKWKLAGYRYELIPVGPNIREAQDVVEVIQPYARPFQTVVGHLDKVGATPAERARMTTMLMLDAIRASTQADLALNSGDDGFFDAFRHKEITRYDIYAAMPFKDHVATADLTGAEIQDLRKARPDTVVSGDASHLDAAKTYRVACVDFIARDVYKLPDSRLQDTGRDLRDVVIAYLGQHAAVAPASARRIQPVLSAAAP